MKKVLLLVLTLVMVLSLAACGGGESAGEKKTGGLYEVAAFDSTLSQGSVADLKGTVSDYIDTTLFGDPLEYEDGSQVAYYCTSDLETPLDYKINVAGEVITLPSSVSDVKKTEWDAELPERTVEAYDGGVWLSGYGYEFAHSSGAVAEFGIFNLEKKDKDLKDCKVCTVVVEQYVKDSSTKEIVANTNVPTFEINGTLNNKSTMKDVMAVLGTPANFKVMNDTWLDIPVYSFKYEVDHDDTTGAITWVFAKDGTTLISVEYENYQ